MTETPSAPRRLDVSDFEEAKVAEWISAAGEAPSLPGERSEADADAAEWVVAYTNPRREEEVRTAVVRRAMDAYVPAMTVTRRREDVRRPVFPGYVFIGLRPQQTTYALAGTPGLYSLVRCDGAPVVVDPAVIRGLRQDEASGVFDFTAARERQRAEAAAAREEAKRVAEIQPGRRVRMVGGTWAQFSGTVLAHMSGGRVLVELMLFARPMPVPIPLACVRLMA